MKRSGFDVIWMERWNVVCVIVLCRRFRLSTVGHSRRSGTLPPSPSSRPESHSPSASARPGADFRSGVGAEPQVGSEVCPCMLRGACWKKPGVFNETIRVKKEGTIEGNLLLRSGLPRKQAQLG